MPTAASLNGHSGDNEIGTPDDLFAWLNRRFRFDYDAFASHENTLAKSMRTYSPFAIYSTKEGTFSNRLEWSNDHDGLLYPWRERRVFWNPPYGAGEQVCKPGCTKKKCIKRGGHCTVYVPSFEEFVSKAIAERNNVDISVGLVKYDASTTVGRLLRENFHLEYLPRVKYKGMTTAATFASVLAINVPDFMGGK